VSLPQRVQILSWQDRPSGERYYQFSQTGADEWWPAFWRAERTRRHYLPDLAPGVTLDYNEEVNGVKCTFVTEATLVSNRELVERLVADANKEVDRQPRLVDA